MAHESYELKKLPLHGDMPPFSELTEKGDIYSHAGRQFYENLFISMFFPVFCRAFSNVFLELDMEIINIPVADFFCDRINF